MAATLPAPAQTRRARTQMVASETSKSMGTLISMPAGAPEWPATSGAWADGEGHSALAAMDAPKKPAAKPATKPPAQTTKPAAKTPAKVPGKAPTKKEEAWTPPVLDMIVPVGGGGSKSSSTGEAGSPDVAYAFIIDINGTKYGMFSEIGGISWKAEPVPVRSGGNNEWVHNMRGPGKFEPLTLKRGWFASTGEFFNLLKIGLQGNGIPTGAAGRFKLTIQCLNRKYQPIGHYDFFACFFVEYSGPGFNAMSGQVGFEQIRVAYDYFTYAPK